MLQSENTADQDKCNCPSSNDHMDCEFQFCDDAKVIA